MRESYIKSAGQKVLLDEEVLVMEEIISSWCSYQNIERLQNPWERRSFFHKDYKIEFLKLMKRESSFTY